MGTAILNIIYMIIYLYLLGTVLALHEELLESLKLLERYKKILEESEE